MSFDGHFIVTTSSKQLITGWITMQDEDLQTTKPCLYKVLPEPRKSEKKTKSFLGFKYSGEPNLANLCKFHVVEKPNSKFATESDEESKDDVPQVHEAKSAIEDALKSVNERGDRIKTLDVKIRELTEKSKNFAELAAELAEKNRNKKWWQL